MIPRSRSTLTAALVAVAALLLAACGDQLAGAPAGDAVDFTVHVVETSGADRLAPVDWALGADASLEAAAFSTATDLVASLRGADPSSLNAAGLDALPSQLAGRVWEFRVRARPGAALSLRTALEASGAELRADGVALFDAAGAPRDGDLGAVLRGADGAAAESVRVIATADVAAPLAPTLYLPGIQLLGINEAPTSVLTDASGEAEALFVSRFVVVAGSFQGLSGPLTPIAGSPAHVHAGARGETGGIVFNLDVSPREDERSGSLSGFAFVADPEPFASGATYINIHSEAYPAGELRGQISIEQPEGAVFTLDNEGAPGPGPSVVDAGSADAGTPGNDVVAAARWSDGRLFGRLDTATGDDGDDGGLSGTSNPLTLSDDRGLLFVVNGGSASVSSFRVSNLANLELIETVPSGGPLPISLTVFGDLLYVLNAGSVDQPGTIQGFRIGARGHLDPIPGSSQFLDGTPGDANVPAQILFSPDGRFLVVTDRSAASTITTFRVGADGRAGAPVSQPSAGATPFGFEFAPNGTLVVSEAQGGPPNISSVSSYRIEPVHGPTPFGRLDAISEQVSTEALAACWVEITDDGRFVYTTNTASGNVTGFALADDGTLTRLPDDVAFTTTGAGPLDIDNVGSDFMYVHSFEADGDGQIASYRVDPESGALVSLASRIADLPASARGVASY